MTSSHIFFIPGMIMVGMVLGFILGARAQRNQVELQKRRDEEREAARAARAAKRAAGGEPKPEAAAEPVEEPKPSAGAIEEQSATKPLRPKGKGKPQKSA